jgi:hypothetical protein
MLLLCIDERIGRCHITRPTLQANGFEQPAKIPGGALIEVEIVWRCFTFPREFRFEPL